MRGNTVEIKLRIAREQLGADAEASARKIKSSFKDIGIDVDIDTSRARDELGALERQGNSLMQGIAQGIGQRLLDFAIDGLQRLGSAAIDSLGKAAEAANSHARAMRVVDQQVALAGDTAQITASELDEMGIALGEATLSNRDQVIGMGRSLLAFENISRRAFRAAPELALDISEVSGNAEQNIRLLGRALDDPVKNLGRLSRAVGGLDAENERLIKGLAEQGRLFEAQDALVATLEKRYDGLARAAAQGLVGAYDTLQERIGRAQVAIGRAIDPALAGGVNLLSDALVTAGTQSKNLDLLAAASAELKTTLEGNPELAEALGQALAEVADVALGQVAAGLRSLTEFLRENPQLIAEMASGMADFLTQVIDAVAGLIKLASLIGGVVSRIEGFANNLPPQLRNLAQVPFAGPGVFFAGDVGKRLANFGAQPERDSGGGGAAKAIEQAAKTEEKAVQELARQRSRAADEQEKTSQKIAQQRVKSAEEIAQAQAKAQADASREALKTFEGENRKTEAALNRSLDGQILAIRRRGALELQSEEQIQQQIQQARFRSSEQLIAQKQTELAKLQQLQQQRLVSTQDAADKELRLAEQIDRLRIEQERKRLELQRQRGQELVQQQFSPLQNQLEQQSGALGGRASGLSGQLTQLQALVGVQQAQQRLEQARLDTQLQQAEAAGRSQQAERLRSEQIELQIEHEQERLAAQSAQLTVETQIAKIESQRQLVAAQLAESQTAQTLAEAQLAGESQRQLEQLQTQLDLRRQDIDLAQQNVKIQETVSRAKQAELAIERQISDEGTKQLRTKQQAEAKSNRSSARSQEDRRVISERVELTNSKTQADFRLSNAAFNDAARRGGDRGLNLLAVGLQRGLQDNISFLRRLNLNGFEEVSGLLQQLQGLQSFQVSALVPRLQTARGGEQEKLLAEIRDTIGESLRSPRSVTIQDSNAVGNLGEILSTLKQQSVRRARL